MRIYHPDLIIEMDETLAPWCPQSNTTYAPEGTPKIRLHAQDDKRGNTVSVSITKSNKLLPFHMIWEGLTQQSIPTCCWPDSFVNSFAGLTGKRITNKGKEVNKSNKWQNRKTMLEYMDGIVKPYIQAVRAREGFREESETFEKKDRCLLILDHHYSHTDESLQPVFENLKIDSGMVPKKATDWFSVLDVAVNKPFKDMLKTTFTLYCSNCILKQLAQGVQACNVKLDV